MKTRIVFDVDDTICHNDRKLGYDKCEPDFAVIKKINYLHDVMGLTIVLHTSRGMVSCDGDEEKIIAKNKKVLEDWLKKHGVKYDELIFCKPIADLYVDDKAMNVLDFKREDFGFLSSGGSGKKVLQLGNIVKKEFGSSEETSQYKDWVEDNKGACKFPRVISYLYDSVYMDFVSGHNLSELLGFSDFAKVVDTIVGFSKMKASSFYEVPHVNVLLKNISNDKEMNELVYIAIDLLYKFLKQLNENASYCHGDLILSNVIKSSDDGELFFIDPRYIRGSSSYLLDFAKLRNSLCGYELAFGMSKYEIPERYLAVFDNLLKENGIYNVVLALQFMYAVRLYRYRNAEQKKIVKAFAKEFIKEYENELFGY